jgi:hypothetical protein
MPDLEALTPLGSLRWHWGSAYEISGIPGAWRAERRDNGKVLAAGNPVKLRALIWADYARKRVPRSVAP